MTQVAERAGLATEVAVIVAVSLAGAWAVVAGAFSTALIVTLPLASTVARPSLLEVHVTLLSAASLGNTVAMSCSWSPVRLALNSVKLSVIEVGFTTSGATKVAPHTP
ncbi:Uncharacterised protein [Chlamydia trachomatis]|nr:Uncharacterised protein [Chlamydia trachomatis]